MIRNSMDRLDCSLEQMLGYAELYAEDRALSDSYDLGTSRVTCACVANLDEAGCITYAATCGDTLLDAIVEELE